MTLCEEEKNMLFFDLGKLPGQQSMLTFMPRSDGD